MSYTLDTNIILHLLRGSSTGKKIEELFAGKDDPTLIISIVSYGEMMAIAIKNGYGTKKIDAVKKLLSNFLVIYIDNLIIIEKYAQIDAISQGKLIIPQAPEKITPKNMGKNDLWIAATALVTQSTLLTTDNDFDHLGKYGFINIQKITV